MTRARGKEQLGAILIREGLIDQGQLDKALESQVIFGGRLGTNLVDLHLLAVDQVGRYLSRQLGVPVATFDQMISAPREALAVINKDLCARYRVLPFGISGATLQLAMLEPNDLVALDELAFVTGKRIERFVAPELRLLQMLEKRYGILREKRYLRVPDEGEQPGAPGAPSGGRPAPRRPLISAFYPVVTVKEPAGASAGEQSSSGLKLVYLDDVARPSGQKQATAPAAPAGKKPDLVGAPPADRAAADDDFELLIEVDEPEAAPAAVTVPAADLEPEVAEEESSGIFIGLEQAPAPAPTTKIEEALAALDRALDREVVIKWLVQPLLPGASCMLFMVRGQMAVGHAASETRTPRKELQGLVLPLTAPSLLQQAFTGRKVVRGVARNDPFQQMISRFLRWPEANMVCVAPICHDDQVINLLCIQAPPETIIEPGFVEQLGELSARAAAAYARQIVEHKRPPKETPAPMPGPEQAPAPAQTQAPLPAGSPPPSAEPAPARQPTQRPALPRPAAPAAAAPALARPTLDTTLYFITGQLGTRGPATIWRAIDTTTHAVVTIDLLPADALSPDEAQRLARQVETLRRLEHPNLPRLFGAGRSAEGQPYVITEWIDGIDLRTKLVRDALPPRGEVANILGQICGALDRAHGGGICHLDLNPDTVMLLAPEHQTVKVLDFGLTREVAAPDLPPAPDDLMLGAPAYRAPERSGGAEVGTSADVFSVAMLSYEMLAGHQASAEEVVSCQRGRPPMDLMNVPMRALRVVMQGLAADPRARPPVGEFGRELTNALLELPV